MLGWLVPVVALNVGYLVIIGYVRPTALAFQEAASNSTTEPVNTVSSFLTQPVRNKMHNNMEDVSIFFMFLFFNIQHFVSDSGYHQYRPEAKQEGYEYR